MIHAITVMVITEVSRFNQPNKLDPRHCEFQDPKHSGKDKKPSLKDFDFNCHAVDSTQEDLPPAVYGRKVGVEYSKKQFNRTRKAKFRGLIRK